MVGIGMYSLAFDALVTYRHAAFIEKLLNLDTEGRFRIITCGEELHCTFLQRLDQYLTMFITCTLVAYNRVALTDYFQHRNVEKLYLNQRK